MIKLILFDIDGTLVLTGGAGARAMTRAFEELFGVPRELESIPMAGRTDAWIVSQMATQCGLASDDPVLPRFQDAYVDYLAEEIHHPGPRKGVLPGVRPLLEALDSREDVHVGLLTGNFERGARIKLQYFDLWQFFRSGAFGDGAHERNGLLPVALERAAACGVRVPSSDVVIVGDTPLDVEVALSGGARSLAVATGSYDADALRASGADVVFEDLSDLDAVLEAVGANRSPA